MMTEEIKKLLSAARDSQRVGNIAEAEKTYRQILDQQPDLYQAEFALALLLQASGRIQDAVTEAQHAMQHCPNPSAAIWTSYGSILQSAGYTADAEAAYMRALQLDPESIAAKTNRAVLAMNAGRTEQAEQMLQELCNICPDDPVLWLNRTRLALDRADLEQAESCLQHAERAKPDHPDLPLLRALVAAGNEDIPAALDYVLAALEQNPVRSEGWDLLKKFLREYPLPLERLEKILHCLAERKVQNPAVLAAAVSLCRENLIWEPLADLEMHLAGLLTEAQRLDFNMSSAFTLFACNVPQIAHRHAAEKIWQRICRDVPLPARELHPLAEIAPLRVAFLASGFYNHPTGHLMAGVLEKLPKGKIVWYAYSSAPDDHSEVRKRIKSGFDRFINVSKMDDADIAKRIRRDRIDILIDRNGVAGGSRATVLAYRAAPIQITWMGTPGTLGSGDATDYIFGDKWVTPLELADGFDEKIVQLPRCYQTNDDIQPDLSVAGTRADHGLPENVPVLCCFNQHYKFSPETFVLWGKIMHAVPNAFLWLMDVQWGFNTAAGGIRPRLQMQLRNAGIDPARVILAKAMPQKEHIARISLADLVLDTLPYNAHTTCSDALRAGIPVITLLGKTFAGRVAASILDYAKLQEWIAANPEDYVQKAIAYAKLSRETMNAVKAQVHDTYWQSTMPDATGYAKMLERLFLSLYNRHVTRLPLKHLRADEDGTLVELE